MIRRSFVAFAGLCAFLNVSIITAMDVLEGGTSEFSKPQDISAWRWLDSLKIERNKAELKHDFKLHEVISREISATIAGKYGITVPIESELLSMFQAIISTRDYYKGKPNILNDFYFSYGQQTCWQKVHSDDFFAHHMAVVAVVDALYWGLITDGPFFDLDGSYNEFKRAQDILEEFLYNNEYSKIAVEAMQIAQDIHDDETKENIKYLIGLLKLPTWQNLTTNIRAVLDITAPEISFLNLMSNLVFETKYKGWDLHNTGQFASWSQTTTDGVAGYYKQAFLADIQSKPQYCKSLVRPLTAQGILLTSENINKFANLPHDIQIDGQTVIIEYRFFAPELRGANGTEIILPTLPFYLTRRITSPEQQAVLNRDDSATLAQRDTDYRQISLFMQYARKYPDCARDYFEAAANLGFPGAMNNYAIVLNKVGQEQEALKYVKRAADMGVAKSMENYSKADSVSSQEQVLYAKMAELHGSRTRYGCEELRQLFKHVKFVGPQPHSIVYKKAVKVKKPEGDESVLEVHFKDSLHLRQIVAETSLFSANRIYFVRDDSVEADHEFNAAKGIIEREIFIHVLAEKPLKLIGNANIPYQMVIPKRSEHNGLTFKGKAISAGGLDSCSKALSLADNLDTFQQEILVEKTIMARRLFEDRACDRLDNPQNYPELNQMDMSFIMSSDDVLHIQQKDFLHTTKSGKFVTYMAPNLITFKEIEKQLPPMCENGVFLIDSSITQAGVYSIDSLCLHKAFHIGTDGNLGMAGRFALKDHDVVIRTQKNLWMLGMSLHGRSINIYSGGSLLLDKDLKKPSNMPDDVWKDLYNFWEEENR